MARKRSLLYICFLHLLFVQVCQGVESDKVETEDDKLISLLLDTSGKKEDAEEGSQVSQILKAIDAAENGTTTTTPKSATSSSKISSRVGEEDPEYDEVIEYLERSFREAHGIDKNGQKISPAEKRKDSHEPPLENLLWGTAKAVWDVGRPVFYKTSAGRKISLIQDTVTLSIRTFGWLKKGILDLTTNPHRRRLVPRSNYHGWDDHNHHHHDHGWGEGPVYVRYEPENSLFKSWLKYLYRAVKPAVISKVRLKRRLLTAKFRFLAFLIRFLKAAKVQKILGAIRAITNRIVKSKLRPDVVVLKEAPKHKGWGSDSGWSLWPWSSPKTTPAPLKSGWSSSTWVSGPPPGWSPTKPSSSYGVPPPPKNPPSHSYGAPPVAPSYEAPPPSQHYGSSIPEIIYGPPAKTAAGYQRYNYQDATPPPPPSPPASYSNANTYSNYQSPTQILTAPSDHHITEVELPSYAKYLRQLAIDHTNLESLDSIRSMRQSEKEEEVPYLITDSSESSSASSNNDDDEKKKKEQ